MVRCPGLLEKIRRGKITGVTQHILHKNCNFSQNLLVFEMEMSKKRHYVSVIKFDSSVLAISKKIVWKLHKW